MASKNFSGLRSLLKRLQPLSCSHLASIEHQGCSWSRVRSLHASCQASSASVSSTVSPSEANLKDAIIPDRLIWKLEVHCQGHDKAVMKSYARFLQMTCQHLGINAGPAVHGTPTHERITLLKSVHIHGKHRAQYEMQTYPLELTAFHLTGSTADTFLEYIQRMCPEGVIMKVTEHTLNKFPASMMQVLTDARTRNRSAAEKAESSSKVTESASLQAKSASLEAKSASLEAKSASLKTESASRETGGVVADADK